MANALSRLDVDRAFVVHGSDGLDEITTTGPTTAFEVRPGIVVERTLNPSDFGLPYSETKHLTGASKEENCRMAKAVLDGATGAARDIVIANAAAALWLAGTAVDLNQAARLAEYSIDSGAAKRKLQSMAAVTKRLAESDTEPRA